jgi:hypothetical protein
MPTGRSATFKGLTSPDVIVEDVCTLERIRKSIPASHSSTVEFYFLAWDQPAKDLTGGAWSFANPEYDGGRAAHTRFVKVEDTPVNQDPDCDSD